LDEWLVCIIGSDVVFEVAPLWLYFVQIWGICGLEEEGCAFAFYQGSGRSGTVETGVVHNDYVTLSQFGKQYFFYPSVEYSTLTL
jgi:hypothetical protein